MTTSGDNHDPPVAVLPYLVASRLPGSLPAGPPQALPDIAYCLDFAQAYANLQVMRYKERGRP